jgi:hypothetical protein
MLKIANSLRSNMLFSYAFYHPLNSFLTKILNCSLLYFIHIYPQNIIKKDFELIPLLRGGSRRLTGWTAFKCSVTATPNFARRYSTQDNINIFIDSRLGSPLNPNASNNEKVNIG